MTSLIPFLSRNDNQSNRARWAALITLMVLVVIGAVLATVLLTGNDDPATAADESQVEASCGEWMGSTSGAGQPDQHWCTDMFAWMDDQSGGSMSSMMDNMMWQGSSRMGRTCRAWVAAERSESGAAEHCDAMVGWMGGHMSSKGGRWMMGDR